MLEEPAGDPARRRIRSAARPALRRLPARHAGISAHERCLLADVRRAPPGPHDHPGRRTSRGRIAGRNRLYRLYAVKIAGSQWPEGFLTTGYRPQATCKIEG